MVQILNKILNNDFDEFLLEAYLLDEYHDLLTNNSEMVIFVKWAYLFMAHWQRLLDITTNCLLLKFLFVFLKVIFENV